MQYQCSQHRPDIFICSDGRLEYLCVKNVTTGETMCSDSYAVVQPAAESAAPPVATIAVAVALVIAAIVLASKKVLA